MLFVVGCVFVVCSLLFVGDRWCSLLVVVCNVGACRFLLVACCLLVVAFWLLLVVCCLLFVSCVVRFFVRCLC